MNHIIRITKRFCFEAAHLLNNHDHECKFIHGHSYKLFVTVLGRPLKEKNHPKNGMVLDFKDLKKLVNEKIICVYDHALIIDSITFKNLSDQNNFFSNMKIVQVDFQTTCENLLINFANILVEPMRQLQVSLHSLKLYETEDSYAEWFNKDQIQAN